jgi:hypothetical protein
MTLGEYIEEVDKHRIIGGVHPWYVFKGHRIPVLSDAEGSLVKYESCPTPPLLQHAFERYPQTESVRGLTGVDSRKLFVSAQFALGGEGTGAPVRFFSFSFFCILVLTWHI